MQTQKMTNQYSSKRFIYTLLLVCLSLSLFTSCESRKAIVFGRSEKEANEIIVFLSTKGIDAAKVKSTETGGGGAQKLVLWDITVPEEESTYALKHLNQAGLPRRQGQNLLGIFQDGGLVPSEMTERIRYQAGLAEQIASTIRKIDGVLDAEVQISFPEEDLLNPGKSKGHITASVYIKHSGVLDDPNTLLPTKIKRLVTSSVTGLQYDNVTIISDRARYSDFPIGLQGVRESEKDYVKTWSIIVAKESLTRFRLIFFSFSIIVLTLLLAMTWIGWKVFPILKQRGGLGGLLSLTPITEEMHSEHEEESEDMQEDENEQQQKQKEQKKTKEAEEEETPPTDVT